MENNMPIYVVGKTSVSGKNQVTVRQATTSKNVSIDVAVEIGPWFRTEIWHNDECCGFIYIADPSQEAERFNPTYVGYTLNLFKIVSGEMNKRKESISLGRDLAEEWIAEYKRAVLTKQLQE